MALAGSRLLSAISLLAVGACATDAVVPPEPEIYEPGSFVLVDEPPADGGGGPTLYRSLETFRAGHDVLIVLRAYDVHPTGQDDARRMAQLPALPVRGAPTGRSLRAWPDGPHSVVWFRTLTDAELP